MTDTYCPNFTYLGHLFTLLELEDQNETIFISDDTDYIVTRVENAWLMHHVHDNEPVMFGLIPHSAKGIFIVKTLKEEFKSVVGTALKLCNVYHLLSIKTHG